MRLATLGAIAVLGCRPGPVPTLTPEDTEQLDCARDVVMAAGFSISSLRPQLSASRQSTFDAYDYVSVAPNTVDTVCAPLIVHAGKGVADTDGNVRYFWDTQSVIGSEVRSAILERCGCTSAVDDSSTRADHDR